ncbi:MAG TPA: tachylectin-related carbohydrate-binding protein, partial [Pseudonocardiaceae bacterium]
LMATGDLRWYRYQPATASWAAGSTRVIASGWTALRQVAYAGDGVFYAVDGAGRLRWYRHLDPAAGAARWATGSGRVIDDGWADTPRIFAAGGAIYATTVDGDLRWYGYTDPMHGNGDWLSSSGAVIDHGGWDAIAAGVAVRTENGSAAMIYTIGTDGHLRRDQHNTPDTGTDSWVVEPGEVIGSGWLN